MSSLADANDMKCAACGKGGDDLKACTACKLVKYCNASCQGGHWSKHKKECKKRAAEIHDEALFKEPLERDECDICMLPLPLSNAEMSYQACCGQTLCYGCIRAAYMADNRQLCPFCRTPEAALDEEIIKRIKKRAEGDDAVAIHLLGSSYFGGRDGLPQDVDKGMKLWLRAGELGYAVSYYNIAKAYHGGNGVERDMEKAKHYYELGAMRGHASARHNLGAIEGNAGNIDRAVKHWMISARAGLDESLKEIQKGFMNGHVTKDEFEKALRAHKESKDEMKSDQREAAAAFAAARGES